MSTIPHSNAAARKPGLPTWSLQFLALAVLWIVSTVALSGCRTTEGLGRDVEHLGDNIADSAERHKP